MEWIKTFFLDSNNNTEFSNIKFENIKSKCYQCSGSGFIIRKEPFKCKNCEKNEKIRVCYLCENVERGKYVECNKCYGTGNFIINNKYINEKRESC